MKELKCAIIGLGRIGCGFDDKPNKKIRTHAKAYFKNPLTKITAFCDIDKKKLEKYGKKYNVKNLYENVDEMFLNENFDCVSICTLANTHLELVVKSVKNGVKAIFLEKPISDNLENANKIVELCKKNKIVLLIDHQRRFDPFYHSIKFFIEKNGLGKIHNINIYYGGGITNTGTHIFDLLRLIFGEVKSLSARYSINKTQNFSDPNLDVHLHFKNNVQCFLHALDLSNYGVCEMDIFGTNGRILVNLITNEIKYYKINYDNFQDYRKLEKTKLPFNKSIYAFDISLGINNLINSIRKKGKILCSGYDGYKSLELSIASILSANNKSSINIPLKNKDYTVLSK